LTEVPLYPGFFEERWWQQLPWRQFRAMEKWTCSAYPATGIGAVASPSAPSSKKQRRWASEASFAPSTRCLSVDRRRMVQQRYNVLCRRRMVQQRDNVLRRCVAAVFGL